MAATEQVRVLRVQGRAEGMEIVTAGLDKISTATVGVAKATSDLDSVQAKYLARQNLRTASDQAYQRQLVAMTQLSQNLAALNDNVASNRSFGINDLEIASTANHLKQAAVAAYALSPAFRELVNPVIVSGLSATGTALAAMGPTAATVATAIGSRLLPALTLVARVAGPILLIKDAFDLMSYSTELAKKQIEDFSKLAEKANASGFSTEFFQRISKAAETAKQPVDTLTEALRKFNEVSTDKLGGSDLQNRLSASAKAGNFAGNTGLSSFASSGSSEQNLRAIVDLINQAMVKGERLAALDIAGTAFGPKVQTALRANSGYLDELLQRADAVSKTSLISEVDIGRALDLKMRMEDAQKVLAEKWKPIQDDLARLGMNYHQSWVEITEDLAAAVGYATSLYQTLSKVPDWFAKRIGGASIWTDIVNATTTPEGRAASEKSLGISSDPKDMASVGANAQLTAALQNRANITRAMQAATDTYSKVLGDNSRAITDNAKTHKEANDFVDRAANTLNRHIEQQLADTAAMGLGVGALARFRAEAALTAAVQANGGKITAEQAANFETLKQKAEGAAVGFERARIANSIAFGRQTSLLSPDDVTIAQQLKGLYPDVATALASMQASGMRTNATLSGLSSTISSNLTTGIADAIDGTKSFSQAMQDTSKVVIRAIEEMIIKLLIIGPLMRSLQSGLGGFLGAGDFTATGTTSAVAGASSGMMGGISFPMFASGTNSAPGGPAVINEGGRGEIVNLPSGAQVIPHDISMRMAAAGLNDAGGSNVSFGDIHINVPEGTPSTDAAAIAAAVKSTMIQVANEQIFAASRQRGVLNR